MRSNLTLTQTTMDDAILSTPPSPSLQGHLGQAPIATVIASLPAASLSAPSPHHSFSRPITIPSAAVFNGEKELWPTAKHRILALLMSQGVMETVESVAPVVVTASGNSASSSSASSGVSASEMASWKERANRAYTILIMCIQCKSLSVKLSNIPLGDAYAVWKVLLARFERQSTSSLLQVTEMLHKERLNESDAAPLDMFVARVQSHQIRLNGFGEPPSDSLLKVILLKGLPSSYDSIVVVLRAGKESFDEMVSQLEDHEEFLRSQTRSKSSQDEVASFARDNNNNRPQAALR